jgi:cell division septal protein FtsQ
MPARESAGLPLNRDLPYARRGRRRSGGSLLLLLLALAFFGGALWLHGHLTGSPLWVVRSIVVEGNRSIEMTDLLDRLGLSPGMPWWRVRSRAAALQAAEPRLASVEIGWRRPRDLIVRVRERQSFLRLLTSPPLEVGTDGVLFASNEELDPLDLPLLTGALPPTLGPRQTLQLGEAGSGWTEFLDLYRRSPATWKNVSEIHYAGGRDFQVYLRGGRRVVLWETGINDPLKGTLPEVLADLERGNRDDVVVDLRFRDQVVLRLPESALSDSAAAGPAKAVDAKGSAGKAGAAKSRVGKAPRRSSSSPARAEHGRRRA